MELRTLEFLCGIKLGTSNHLMLLSEYHRHLTCTHRSTESGEMTLTEVCFVQSEGSRCLSLCQETDWIENPSLFWEAFLVVNHPDY